VGETHRDGRGSRRRVSPALRIGRILRVWLESLTYGRCGAGGVGVIDRLSVLCFAGTYALALCAELARFMVRAPVRWYLAAGLTALAWLVQMAYLANLAIKSPMAPVATAFGSLMLLSWIVALIGLYLMLRSPRQVAVGMFVLPLVLGLVVGAGWFAPRESDWLEWGGTVAFWGAVHGIFLLGGAVFTCVAFFAGLMYLAQMRRLKAKRPSRTGLALPSLEQSERINRGAIAVAFPLLTFGLVIGVILSLAARVETSAHVIRWTDPKVLSALLMWLVFAILLHARFRPAMRGRGMMMLTIVAFAFLVFTWMGIEALGLRTAHGAVKGPDPGRAKAP
jgi:ABC-type transport system involved in cytochrome c biogenesis permease subunit